MSDEENNTAPVEGKPSPEKTEKPADVASADKEVEDVNEKPKEEEEMETEEQDGDENGHSGGESDHSDEEEKPADSSTSSKESPKVSGGGDAKQTAKSSTPSPKKPAQKRKRETKPEVKDESDEEEEEKVGLLEQPAVLETGSKRQRKKVERLDTSVSTPKEGKKLEIADGSGVKLGDMPRVEFQINKHHAEDLKPIHKLCFGSTGRTMEVKKNLRKFSGFTFDKDSTDYTKKQQSLQKSYTVAVIKHVCDVLDVEKKGTKEEVIERLLDFCLNPQPTGKKLPKPKKKKARGKGKKKKDGETKKRKSSPKKKPAKSKEVLESDEDGDDDEDEEESEKEEEETEEEEVQDESDQEEDKSESEEEEKEPPKKKAKKEVEKKPKKEPKKKETKKPVKRTPKKKKEESEDSDSDEDSDDEPLVAKKKPPSDDDIKDCVRKILDGANLEEITMKTVCKQVYAKYPDFDLTHRKDFIKSTVKQIIR